MSDVSAGGRCANCYQPIDPTCYQPLDSTTPALGPGTHASTQHCLNALGRVSLITETQVQTILSGFKRLRDSL